MKTLQAILVLACCLVVGIASCSNEQVAPVDVNASRVAALFDPLNVGVQPGAAVLVMKDGEVVFEGGFGYADLENSVRITTASSFRLASVSKQFTTAAIMVLADEGKLDYDDLLVEHVPEFNDWPGVTIAQLMNHTSGIPDYYEAGFYEAHDATARMPQNADLIEILSRYSQPDFEPGAEFVYNNAAYEVLVTVIERVTQTDFPSFIQERVFRPAGMATATTFNSSRPDIPNRVFGYSPAEDGSALDDYDPFNDMLGAGGVYATLGDFVAWARALDSKPPFSAAALRAAHTRTILNDGKIVDYGFGWTLDQYRGHARTTHGGSWVGFRTRIARYPDEGLTIVVLCNRSDGDTDHYVDSITDIYLPQRGNAFLPDETQASVIAHHRRIPDDEHWWNVRGEQMAWMHRHTQQMFPTVPVYRSGAVRELEYEPLQAIHDIEIDTPDGPVPFGWFVHSDHSTALGIVMLHKGKIVFESYPRMRPYEKVIYWSVAKALTGAIVRLLEEQGKIDISRPIEFYVPRLADSVHAGTAVQNLLDMATGVDCAENYEDPESCYYLYSEAIGENLRDADSPDDPYEFLATVDIERTGEQGKKFVYSGGTNFLLMWLIEEVTGYTLADAVTQEFWSHIGAENDAAYIAYRQGIQLSHGGFISKMRDLARLGLLYTPSYHVVSDKQIISDAHLEAIMTANRPGLRPTAYAWGDRDEAGYISHGGWGGQGLIINPEKDVVVVFTSYVKDDYSEVSLESAIRRVLDSVFGDPGTG